MICRRPDPKDQRISRLYLNKKGKEIAEEVILAIEENEAVLTDGFSEEELEQLRDFFRRMSENMERLAKPDAKAAEENQVGSNRESKRF